MLAEPNAFVPLANVTTGRQGLLYKLDLGLTATPPWGAMTAGKLAVKNNYVEGCWHLLRTANESLPGQVRRTLQPPSSPPPPPPGQRQLRSLELFCSPGVRRCWGRGWRISSTPHTASQS